MDKKEPFVFFQTQTNAIITHRRRKVLESQHRKTCTKYRFLRLAYSLEFPIIITDSLENVYNNIAFFIFFRLDPHVSKK